MDPLTAGTAPGTAPVAAPVPAEVVAPAGPGPLLDWLGRVGARDLALWTDAHKAAAAALGSVALVVLAAGVLWLTRSVVVRVVARLAGRSTVRWDDALVKHRVFERLAWAAPIILVHQLAGWIPWMSHGVESFVQRLALCALVIVALRALGAMSGAAADIYATFPMAKHRPIKGYLQVVLIVGWIFGVVVVLALILDRSPWLLLSGLGAMTAVLLLVFRDTILSLVAGIQLTTNDLVRIGDWIEMPQFGADGDVTDIGLHAVKVENWDKTITVIPTHRFLEHAFKNWRGMAESGGRRIKRSFNVDVHTIRFLTPEDIAAFRKHALLRDYFDRKTAEIEAHNKALAQSEPGAIVNARRLTNVGTLRAWVTAYLRQHPKVHQDMTFLVRQLQPGPEGLPIEIYVFCNDIRWAEYEAVQADIFDHIFAMVPQLGLRVFQAPSGSDVRDVGAALATARAS